MERNIIGYIELCLSGKHNLENAIYYIWEMDNLTVKDYLVALSRKEDINNTVSFFKSDYELEFDNFRRSIQVRVRK